MIIKGEFEVRSAPLAGYAQSEGGIRMGRLSLDKTYHGDLAATSKGEMLSAMTSIQGSAGYVALELVQGNLGGKKGRFALQHFGTMDCGSPRLILEVVPGSGEEDLKGLSGTMEIKIEGGKHFYVFNYELKS